MDYMPWENKYLREGEEFAEEHFSSSFNIDLQATDLQAVNE